MTKLTRANAERWDALARKYGGDFRFDWRYYVIWGEKTLTRHVPEENGEILETRITYFPEFKEIVNEYGCRYNKATGREIPTITVNRLYPTGTGLYRVVEIERRAGGEAVERKNYDVLCRIAGGLE